MLKFSSVTIRSAHFPTEIEPIFLSSPIALAGLIVQDLIAVLKSMPKLSKFLNSSNTLVIEAAIVPSDKRATV